MTTLELLHAAEEWPEEAWSEETLPRPETADRPRSRGRRGRLMRRALLSADMVGLLAAFFVAQQVTVAGQSGASTELILFVATLPIWVVAAKLYGLYDHDEERTDHSTVDELVGVFHLVTIATWLAYFASSIANVGNPSIGKMGVFWGSAIVMVAVCRAIARTACRRQQAYVQRAIIFGCGDVGQLLARKFATHPEYGVEVLGFVDDRPLPCRADLAELRVLGHAHELRQIVDTFEVDRVVVSFSNDPDTETLNLVRDLRDRDVQVDIVPRFFDALGQRLDVHSVEGLPLIGLAPSRLPRSSRIVKRAVDISVSFTALCVLAIPLAIVALIVKLDSRGPIFFRQTRMGSRGTFRIWKFRTMCIDADQKKADVAHLNQHARAGGDPRMFKVPNDPRVTRVGGFMRRCSIDELPQLINVLCGQMSLVGPRPLILDEDRYVVEKWARRRLDLKPGITGLWQVSGRSDIPFSEMVKLDYSYVTSWSLLNDIQLILRTFPALVRSRTT